MLFANDNRIYKVCFYAMQFFIRYPIAIMSVFQIQKIEVDYELAILYLFAELFFIGLW